MTTSKYCHPLLVALLIAAAGCSEVTSTEKLGEARIANDGGKVKFDGVWVAREGAFVMKSLPNGELRLATVDWLDGHFKVQEHTAFLTENQGVLYVNLSRTDSNHESRYYVFCAMLRHDDKSLILLPPRADGFRTAIERSLLKGRINDGNIAIQSSKKELDAVVTAARFAELFDLQKPLVLHRAANWGS